MNKKKLPFKRTQTDGLSLKAKLWSIDWNWPLEVVTNQGAACHLTGPMGDLVVIPHPQVATIGGRFQRSTVTTRHNHLCPSSLSLWPPQYWNIRNIFCSKIFFFGFNPARVAVVACPLSISLVLSAVYNLHIFMCFYSREYSTMFT